MPLFFVAITEPGSFWPQRLGTLPHSRGFQYFLFTPRTSLRPRLMMDKPEEQNFGEMLIEGLREAVAIARGEMEPARVSIHRVPETPPPAED